MVSPGVSVAPVRGARRGPAWPALDGLRAFAVVAVVAFHAAIPFARNGYVGVDVFFVLSGFLITRLLLDEHRARGRIDLKAFYARRALRLLPALALVCLVVVALAVAFGRQVTATVEGAGAALFYVANFWLYSGHPMPLLDHTWTLSLEEQFYLLWPLLLVGLLAVRRPGRVAIVVGVLGVLAVLLLLPAGGGLGGVQSNYLRATGLLAGCAIAWFPSLRTWRGLRVVAPACLAVLLVVLFVPWQLPGFLFTQGYSVAALLTIPCVLWLTSPSPAAGLMSTAPLRWVGRRSYGLYLWHFPILSLALHQSPSWLPDAGRVVVGVGASFFVAALSYRIVEHPFLRLKSRFERARA